jgi:acyl-CoA synthetase (AMP-forming)/AMP-acid ligase II
VTHAVEVRAAAPTGTLVETLRWRAENEAGRLAYRFLPDGESRAEMLTYAELDRRVRAVAALLQSFQSRGERALVIYPPGLDFISAYFGCLYAGTVALVLPPPNRGRLVQFLDRAIGICRDATPTVVLTTAAIQGVLAAETGMAAELGAARWLAVEGELESREWRPFRPTGVDLAFLQYTSGSTTEPRGVMVTHGNLAHNLRAIAAWFAEPLESESVCWLPPHHDMGLIGGILAPLHLGAPATLFPAAAFVQRPWRWLQAISRFRARVSGGPNFGYELCIRRVAPEQCEGIDLSCWEVAFNGAEPIHLQTLRNFTERFTPYGFDSTAFKPCYGLAESTLLVSAGPSRTQPSARSFRHAAITQSRVEPCSDSDAQAYPLTSCGKPIERLVIVDPETRMECAPGHIGEIWVSGPSVAHGYWNRREETSDTFGARLEGEGTDSFLRTGDLGFLLEGELFVTGRLKDLIIIDGANHYPQDIERTAGDCHPDLEPAECAAFSVEVDEREGLVVVAAPRRGSKVSLDDLRRAIRTAVATEHDVRVHEIALVQAGRIPKTSSGKVRRNVCRMDYVARTLDVWRLE